jgi:hypothetical protein
MEMAENFLKLWHPSTRLPPTDVKTKENRPEKIILRPKTKEHKIPPL